MILDHNVEFDFGQIVYLKTDPDQLERMVTAISLRPNGAVSYNLSQGMNETYHYAMEISTEKDCLKATNS